MEQNKNTPGPWTCTENHVDNGNMWISTPLDYTGEVYKASEHYSITEEQSRANAQLIAAAPELLECLVALEDIISGLEAELDNAGVGDMTECREWWYKAGQAIVKARGQS